MPASAIVPGFVPPTLKTKDSGVVLPLLKALVKALVKVMLFPVTSQPDGELLNTPATLGNVQEPWFVSVMLFGNVITI